MFRIPVRTSDAVESMVVSPLRGVVIATFSTGTYEYHNISRRAILNLMAKQYHNFTRLCDMNKVAFDYA